MLRSDYKTHYKMYKAKKNVVYATMFTFAMLGGLGLTQNAKADTVANANAQPMVQTAVNSTVQATSQAVVNSAVSSVAPVSQVSLASSSVSSAAPVAHTDQPASTAVNTFKVAQNSTPVTNVAQSYVQTNQNNQAQNVNGNFDLKVNGSENNATHDVKVPKNYSYTGSVHLDFDVAQADIKSGNQIEIAQFHIIQNSEPKHVNPGLINPLLISKDGRPLGYISIDDNKLMFHVTKNLNDSNLGLVHFHIDSAPNTLLGNYQYPASAYADVNQDQTMTLQLLDPQGKLIDSANITYTKPDTIWNDQNTTYQAIKNTISLINSMNGVTHAIIVFGGQLPDNQINQLVHSNGDNQNHYASHYQFAFHFKKPIDNSLLYDSKSATSSITYQASISDGAGNLSKNESLQIYGPDGVIKQLNMGDNLSLSQLKAKTPNNAYGFSEQDDGSILVFMNFDYDPAMTVNDSYYRNYIATHSYLINSLPKDQQQKAVDTTMRLLNDGAFTTLSSVMFKLTDPTIASNLDVDMLNSDTGTVISSAHSTLSPIKLMASGQSAVKLHVINATNGADLKHLIHFVISPVN